MQTAALTAVQSAAYLNISERRLHQLRDDSDFPRPRLVGGRNRWLIEELEAYLRSRPIAEPQPEPPQLSGSTKRKPIIEPKPETWPVSNLGLRSTKGAI